MTPDQVQDAVGEPSIKDERQHLRAWRYEYPNYLTDDGEAGCGWGGRYGNAPTCRPVCEHMTVWFNDDYVRSMTFYAVAGMEGCGTNPAPIAWEHMPVHVDGPGA